MTPQAVWMPKLDIEVNHTSIWHGKTMHTEIGRISVVDIRNSGSQNMYLHYLCCLDSTSFPLVLAIPRKLSPFHSQSRVFNFFSPSPPFVRCSHRRYIDAGVTYEHHCFPTMNTHMSWASRRFLLYTKHGNRVWGSIRNGKTNTHHQYMCKQRLDSVLPSQTVANVNTDHMNIVNMHHTVLAMLKFIHLWHGIKFIIFQLGLFKFSVWFLLLLFSLLF